jgi:bacillithiol system protein YtxJ
MNWVQLKEESQLAEVSENSFSKPVLIFKHSTRCSVSIMAKRSFENDWNLAPDAVLTYFLDLISYRSVSNKIAEQFEVEHQSPQIILLKNGKVVYHVSHSDIDFKELTKVL